MPESWCVFLYHCCSPAPCQTNLLWVPSCLIQATPLVWSITWYCITCTGQAREKGDSAPPLTLPFKAHWASAFQFLKFLAKLWREILFSLLTKGGNTNSYTLPAYAGHNTFMWATCSTAMNWVLNYSARCTPTFMFSPLQSLPEPLKPLGASWHGTTRIVSSRVFNGQKTHYFMHYCLSITSEQEESKTSEIWVTTEKKQELLLLAIIPYLIIVSFLHFYTEINSTHITKKMVVVGTLIVVWAIIRNSKSIRIKRDRLHFTA